MHVIYLFFALMKNTRFRIGQQPRTATSGCQRKSGVNLLSGSCNSSGCKNKSVCIEVTEKTTLLIFLFDVLLPQ